MDLAAALLGVLTGGATTYIGAVIKFRKDLEAEYDRDLRTHRITTYEVLWKELQALPRFDLPHKLTPESLAQLSVAMRKWYFETGGIFLSEPSRKTYFKLKRALSRVEALPSEQWQLEIAEPERRRLIHLASLLRTQLTKDIGTRKSSALADS